MCETIDGITFQASIGSCETYKSLQKNKIKLFTESSHIRKIVKIYLRKEEQIWGKYAIFVKRNLSGSPASAQLFIKIVS